MKKLLLLLKRFNNFLFKLIENRVKKSNSLIIRYTAL
jgi:hypothetical protein